MLSPFLCFVSLLYLDLNVLRGDTLESLWSFIRTKHLFFLVYIISKGAVDLLAFLCVFLYFLPSHTVFKVSYGTWLYRFLIFTFLITLIRFWLKYACTAYLNMQWLLAWTFALNENLRLLQIYHQQPTSTWSVFHQSNVQELFGALILRIRAKWALHTTAFILCTKIKQAPQNILSLPVPVRQTTQIHFPVFFK